MCKVWLWDFSLLDSGPISNNHGFEYCQVTIFKSTNNEQSKHLEKFNPLPNEATLATVQT